MMLWLCCADIDRLYFFVRSTALHAIHLRFDISFNSLGIKAVQSPKCIIGCAVNCTYNTFIQAMTGFKIVSKKKIPKKCKAKSLFPVFSYYQLLHCCS
jgi:hypothetical protein